MTETYYETENMIEDNYRPKITIITVTKNIESTIEKTIESVLHQAYDNLEYIIIDGKSTDNTLKIINKYKKLIHKIVSEKDNGIYDAMNKGVKLAKGEIIYFLNGDDVLKDGRVINNISKKFTNGIDYVYGDVEFYYPKENNILRIKRDNSLKSLKAGYAPSHQGIFIKKDILLSYPFNLNYKIASDFDFLCKIIIKKFIGVKVDFIIATVKMDGIGSNGNGYKESQEIMKKYFGVFYYYKLKIKQLVFKHMRMLFNKLGLKIHRG